MGIWRGTSEQRECINLMQQCVPSWDLSEALRTQTRTNPTLRTSIASRLAWWDVKFSFFCAQRECHPPAKLSANQSTDLGQVTPEHDHEDGTRGSGGGCQAPLHFFCESLDAAPLNFKTHVVCEPRPNKQRIPGSDGKPLPVQSSCPIKSNLELLGKL